MRAENQKPHYLDHRKRLRERFSKTGFEGFKDYESLELVLTYAIPRKDVKPIAKSLIERFGDFQGALDAPMEELAGVNGIGEYAAIFLKLLKSSAYPAPRASSTIAGPRCGASGRSSSGQYS
jgi:DNA repair protein RadC